MDHVASSTTSGARRGAGNGAGAVRVSIDRSRRANELDPTELKQSGWVTISRRHDSTRTKQHIRDQKKPRNCRWCPRFFQRGPSAHAHAQSRLRTEVNLEHPRIRRPTCTHQHRHTTLLVQWVW